MALNLFSLVDIKLLTQREVARVAVLIASMTMAAGFPSGDTLLEGEHQLVTKLVKKGQSTPSSFHLRSSKTCRGQETMKVS
jgi:hypothetical protein